MKISLLKLSRKKEVIKRLELMELAEMIRENPEKSQVFNLRLNYQFYQPQRMSDGQIVLDSKFEFILDWINCFNNHDTSNSSKREKGFVDVWLVKKDIVIEDLKLQDEEVSKARWVSLKTLTELAEKGEMVNSVNIYIELLVKLLKKCHNVSCE